ncbi:transglutaminase-like domain-containing protein [Myxococcaceae bacterium GXIMD 01537]
MMPSRKFAALVTACAALASAAPVLAQAPASQKKTPAAQAPARAEVSDALKARRPKGGEYLGLYLMDKKVGYLFFDMVPVAGQPGQARFVKEMYFQATVGTQKSERRYREERVYESKPNGRLLSFVIQQRGDGGDQTLEGTQTPEGLRVTRKRPQVADETLTLPASRETVEDADPERVALVRKAARKGISLDGTDLRDYPLSVSVEPSEKRLVNGVHVELGRTTTMSEKEKLPLTSYFAPDGRLVEVQVGPTMKARAEPESVARRLDRVEVFGLTRVVLPRKLPDSAREVPGSTTLVVGGLPDKFLKDSERQKYVKLPDGRVQVTLSARAPKPDARKPLPLADPEGGKNLESDLVVESAHPEIRARAAEILGNEKDAYAAARRIVTWVGMSLQKTYGASADRATDVLRQKKGDCTEHSLLAVALLRASGIPARRVDGVVYMVNDDGVPALYWHEWVEAWVGEWTQMDPTFNQMVADATHFGVGYEANAEITPLIGQLKVLEVR